MTQVQLTKEQAQSIGDLLKEARERRGRQISEVAYQIALSPAQLRAIEAADLRPFYSPNFFYQAAQRYAKFLGVQLPASEPPAPTAPDSKNADTPAPTAPADYSSSLASLQSNVVTNSAAIEQSIPAAVMTGELRTSEIENSRHENSVANTELASKPKKKNFFKWPAIALAFGIAVIAITLGLGDKNPTPVSPEALAAAAQTPPQVETSPTAVANASSPGASNTSTTATTAVTTTPTSTPSTAATPASASQPGGLSNQKTDSSLESQTSAWVQIVRKNGDKTNIKIEPGKKFEFESIDTAAIVLGQPDKAKLFVKGKAVDLNRFVSADNPTRALVIMTQIP